MKVYTRKEIKDLIDDAKQYKALKYWCKDHGLYYEGVVRFLKGADININTYTRILNAADPTITEVCTHYLAARLMYSDMEGLKAFAKQIHAI